MEIINKLPELDLSSSKVPELPSVEFTPIPDGNYKLRLDDVTIKDKNIINFKFAITDGSFKNRYVFMRSMPFGSEKGLQYFKHNLVQFGLTEEEIVEVGKDLSKYLGCLINLNIRGKIKTEEYQGKQYTNVKFLFKAATEDANKAGILANYKDKLGLVDKIAGSEDIPF